MSMDKCPCCDKSVDTDIDDCFYGEDGEGYGSYYALCESCREKLEDEILSLGVGA